MNQVVDPDFDELGAQLGQALRNRVAARAVAIPAMEPVRAGAKRRHAVHRAALVVVCVALIAAAGLALTRRVDRQVPGEDSAAPIVRPTMLPAFAILDPVPSGAQPVAMWATRGGEPMGRAVPRIDVWQSGQRRLVIRTVDNSATPPSPAVTTTAVPTTGSDTRPSHPWEGRSVADVAVRGTDGAIEDLAPSSGDQFAVWVPTSSADRYTLVIGRGISRAEVLADVNSLVDIDGVLQPSAGFTLVESAEALDDITAVPPSAQIVYGGADEAVAAARLPLAGRSSIETAFFYDIGRLVRVDNREVMLVDEHGSRTVATWIDPTGVTVTVERRSGAQDLIPDVRMISESEWVDASHGLSAAIADSMPIADQVSFDGASLIRREADQSGALCLATNGTETCARDASTERPTSVGVQTDVDGHWVIFGYRQILPDEEEYIRRYADSLMFRSTTSACCDVEMKRHGDAYWYLVHVDDEVDIVNTNLGTVFGGMVGNLSRPLVASSI